MNTKQYRRPYYYILLISFLFLIGCVPTVESELNQWTFNISRLEQMESGYPNLKIYLREDFTKAQTMKSLADEEKDEEVKIKTLEAANAIIKGKLYRNLNSCMNGLFNVKGNVNEIKSNYTDELNTDRVQNMLKDAEETILKATEILESNYSSKEEAMAGTLKAKNELDRIEQAMRTYIKFRKTEAQQNNSSSNSSTNKGSDGFQINVETSVDTVKQTEVKIIHDTVIVIKDAEQQLDGQIEDRGGDEPSTKVCTQCSTTNKADATHCMNCKNKF